MAELAPADLIFDGNCPDCGERSAVLPLPIPGVEDDFDWKARDYDSFRLFMMQELASRFPQRRRWTSADMEVVIVEALSAGLDRASHAVDRVQAERFLDTARRPESLRRLLRIIGYDAVQKTPKSTLDSLRDAEQKRFDALSSEQQDEQGLRPDAVLVENYWRERPEVMEMARWEGPRLIAEQRRMVTLADHATTLQAHPLVALARAKLVWTGAWSTVLVSVLLEDGIHPDGALHDPDPGNPDPEFASNIRRELWEEIVKWHDDEHLPLPPIDENLTGRRILRSLIDQFRLIGTEVFLEEARAASITMTLSVRAKPGYFRSELRQALEQVFAADQGAFFEPGRLEFGEALYASDVIEAAMGVEGVAVACLNLFRRVGKGFEDQSADGVIKIEEDEYIRCMNNRSRPDHGTFRILVNAGEAG
ncbi:MAG: hypothetical protein GY952_07460 [Rhodobacteraceae bacterium]|nr:hypothetical protein [Paracoccaceae bacterium]